MLWYLSDGIDALNGNLLSLSLPTMHHRHGSTRAAEDAAYVASTYRPAFFTLHEGDIFLCRGATRIGPVVHEMQGKHGRDVNP